MKSQKKHLNPYHLLPFLFICLVGFPSILKAQFGLGTNCDGGIIVVPIIDTNYCDNSDWQLMFEDNFDGDTINADVWRPGSRRGSTGGGNLSVYRSFDNVKVSDGTCKLITKRERVYRKAYSWKDSLEILDDGFPNIRWFNYTSALIRTYKTFRYGLYEARVKVPFGKGNWSAMWMYGYTAENNYLPNTVDNEIDVYEFWKDDVSDVNMNIHVDGEACLKDWDGPDFSQSFHTFSMLWEPYKIEWYVDGELIRKYPRFYQNGADVGCRLNAWQMYEEAPFPTQPMLIYLSSNIDVHGGYAPDDTTPFPSVHEIDWVRFYSKSSLLNLAEDERFSASIYPNPAREEIAIAIFSEKDKPFEAKLYSSDGSLVQTFTFHKGTNSINIAHLYNGLYYFTLFDSSTMQLNRYKIVKQ